MVSIVPIRLPRVELEDVPLKSDQRGRNSPNTRNHIPITSRRLDDSHRPAEYFPRQIHHPEERSSPNQHPFVKLFPYPVHASALFSQPLRNFSSDCRRKTRRT